MTDDQLRKTTGTGVAPNAWCHLCHSARHHLQLQRCVCCLQLGLNVLPTLKNCIAHYLHRTRNLYTLFARRAFAQGHSLPNRMTARAVKVPRLRVSIPERKSLRKKVHQKEIQRGQAPSKSAQGGKNTALCRGVACKAACLAAAQNQLISAHDHCESPNLLLAIRQPVSATNNKSHINLQRICHNMSFPIKCCKPVPRHPYSLLMCLRSALQTSALHNLSVSVVGLGDTYWFSHTRDPRTER